MMNWSNLVFLSLLLIVEILDIGMIWDAIGVVNALKLNPTPALKSELGWLLMKIAFCTVAIIGGVLSVVFFVLGHL